MTIIEFNPGNQSGAISADDSAADETMRKEVLFGTLPLVFHKLKNKLTPILGYTQILQSRSRDEFTRERLAKIERNTAELTESLTILKEYCRSAPPEMRPGDLNGVVEELAPRWKTLAGAGTKVVLDLTAGLPEVPLHAGHLRILLLAMTENAMEALRVKGAETKEITIATRTGTNGVTLSIRDNGCGMSQDEAAEAWTPFYAKFPDHAGLGLVFCEKIIADHGASCSITSVPGAFSEFAIAFPPAVKPKANHP